MHSARKPVHKDVTVTAAVIDQARTGDHTAFEAIMRAHNRLLYRFVRNLVPGDADAEDVIQETYIKAFRAIDRFDGRARLSTWLVKIALHEVYNRGRKTRMTEQLDTMENVISMAAHLRPSGGLVAQATTPEQDAARDQIGRHAGHSAVDGPHPVPPGPDPPARPARPGCRQRPAGRPSLRRRALRPHRQRGSRPPDTLTRLTPHKLS